jgi:hypothetical protein
MSSHTIKCTALAACCLWSGAALALEPCNHGVPAIDIEQGNFEKAPGYIDPDAQTLRPDGKLQEQRWHNLHAAIRPLRAVCRYANKVLPVICRTGSIPASGTTRSGGYAASDRGARSVNLWIVRRARSPPSPAPTRSVPPARAKARNPTTKAGTVALQLTASIAPDLLRGDPSDRSRSRHMRECSGPHLEGGLMPGDTSLGIRRTWPPHGGNGCWRLSKASVSFAIGAGAIASVHADSSVVLSSGLPVQVKPTFLEPGLPAFSFPVGGSSSPGGSGSTIDGAGGGSSSGTVVPAAEMPTTP